MALQIAQLLEEYSDGELQEAVEFLRERGYGASLLDFLSGKREPAHRPTPSSAASRSTKSKPMEEITSRAVLALRDKDVEKFRVLSEFDALIRRGQLLPTNDDLRRFGERLTKGFEPKKARKETISSLMSVLAELSVKDIEELIEFSASFGVTGNADEYQRLAHYLIKGKEGA
ncbi:hypothetical protein [Burkholderia anthina]|uniref:hypothetical protein n=1 Tax=Burkholderia anthina TaxID=179879 RepID=UPI00158BEF23|nr:hypothetical protein [Burkholderia anthina]